VLIVSAWFPPLAKEDESVPKTPWEDRVKMLLNKPEIVWYYKAPDGTMYGGQPRLDFVACDIFGRFIMIEVKSVTHTAKTFSPRVIVPAVQQDALNKIAETASGVAILAVGHEGILRLYNWGKIRGLPKVSLANAGEEKPFWMDAWKGPASWEQHNLHVILSKKWHSEPGPYSGLGPTANVISASEWTKPYPALPDPLPEITSPLILPLDIQPRRIASTQAGFEAMVKYAQASGSPLVQEMKKEIYEKLESMAPAGVAERVAAEHAAAQGVARPTLEPIQNSVVKRAKPVPPAPPPEKTSGEKRKEILKKANRQHHARQ
jgi:hypothetical protein